MQSFAVKTLLHLSDGPSRFALGAFLLNGYGVPSDAERGLECLPQAASQGHVIAQVYLYRMFMACQKEIPPEIPMLNYLKAQARNGSRLALLDLKALEPQQAKHTREVLKYGCGGVGSNWFHEDQWLQGLTQPKLMSKIFALDCLGSQTELQEVVVNIRKNHIIHTTTTVGAHGLVQELLTDIKIDVNQRNVKGRQRSYARAGRAIPIWSSCCSTRALRPRSNQRVEKARSIGCYHSMRISIQQPSARI